VLLWAEANRYASTGQPRAVQTLRKLVYEAVDGLVIPGKIAEDTIRGDWRIKPRSLLRLPNVVDERLYGDEVARLRSGRRALRQQLAIPDAHLVLLIPARLDEASKGVLRFLQAIYPLRAAHLTLLVAGDGPDRSTIESWMRQSNVDNVRMLGHQAETEMLRLLAVSDVLVLPSLVDPNPLALIEGAWAGLPLVASRLVGNWPETVHEGVNGWLIDPRNQVETNETIAKVLRTPAAELAERGRASLKLAAQFATKHVVSAFLADLDRLR
jgi:glycosyltransferase involved in cell wall biosynthesis